MMACVRHPDIIKRLQCQPEQPVGGVFQQFAGNAQIQLMRDQYIAGLPVEAPVSVIGDNTVNTMLADNPVGYTVFRGGGL